ncbi:MAG: DUF4342 domain-containing protein [Lachnospiraceae bacterium]|nr:DUF4342 domain-containing protein [Lachnospiraceae bacterium]
MDNLEKVEKLREKAGVTYEDAKKALEACEYDMLDALIYLEKLGKVDAPNMSSYTTTPDNMPSKEFEQAQTTYENDCKGTSFGEYFRKFCRWCGELIRKGCDTNFNVMKHGREIISMPVILLVLLAIFFTGLVVLLFVIGLFCDCKYYFDGHSNATVEVNKFCDKASETCENMKNDFQGK